MLKVISNTCRSNKFTLCKLRFLLYQISTHYNPELVCDGHYSLVLVWCQRNRFLMRYEYISTNSWFYLVRVKCVSHLFMLAADLLMHSEPRLSEILSKSSWYNAIQNLDCRFSLCFLYCIVFDWMEKHSICLNMLMFMLELLYSSVYDLGRVPLKHSLFS